MSSENGMFDCCGTWWRCGIFGHCPDIRKDITYRDTRKCGVYRNQFELRDQEFIAKWRKGNYEFVCRNAKSSEKMLRLKRVAEKKYTKEELEGTASTGRVPSSEKVPSRVTGGPVHGSSTKDVQSHADTKPSGVCSHSSGIDNGRKRLASDSFKGIRFYVEGGKIEMTNVKVVATKGDFELISWMHKDLVNYGIREKDGTTMFEQFVPTKELKGWPLRNKCTEALLEYAKNGLTQVESSGKVKQVVTSPYDIEVGHVIVWTNARTKEHVYGKVYSLGEYLTFFVKPDGEEGFWSYQTLDYLMPKGLVKVTNMENVPEGITFPR